MNLKFKHNIKKSGRCNKPHSTTSVSVSIQMVITAVLTVILINNRNKYYINGKTVTLLDCKCKQLILCYSERIGKSNSAYRIHKVHITKETVSPVYVLFVTDLYKQFCFLSFCCFIISWHSF